NPFYHLTPCLQTLVLGRWLCVLGRWLCAFGRWPYQQVGHAAVLNPGRLIVPAIIRDAPTVPPEQAPETPFIDLAVNYHKVAQFWPIKLRFAIGGYSNIFRLPPAHGDGELVA